MSFLEDSQGEVDPVISVEYLHGESPNKFTCQLTASKDKLKSLMEEINASVEEDKVSIGFSCYNLIYQHKWSNKDGKCESVLQIAAENSLTMFTIMKACLQC